ncbi:unnamed protein product [Schistosoma rodhaini]|nr:unnamed protein product [Schistosoma rodhaini]
MLKWRSKIPCQCPHCMNFLHEKYCFAVRYGTIMNNYTDHLFVEIFNHLFTFI